jgi:hypothetical protein
MVSLATNKILKKTNFFCRKTFKKTRFKMDEEKRAGVDKLEHLFSRASFSIL